MALNTGQVIKLNSNVATGTAPGQSQYQAASGSQAKILGSRVINGQNYYNIDQTPFGGGTGWALGSSLESSANGPAASTPAQASSPSTPSAPADPLADYFKQMTDTINNQNTQRDQKYQNYDNQLSSAIDSYHNVINPTIQNAQNKYHVGDLNTTAQNLNSRISQLQGNTDNAGAEGASMTQVDNAVNSRFLPQYNTAVSNLNQSASLANNEISQQLSPYQAKISTLNEQIGREMTGFTQGQQNELTALLSKGSLTEQERQRAQDLALAEQGFQNAKDVAGIGNRYYIDPVNGGLIDAQSGKSVGSGSPTDGGYAPPPSTSGTTPAPTTPTPTTPVTTGAYATVAPSWATIPTGGTAGAIPSSSLFNTNVNSSISNYLNNLGGLNLNTSGTLSNY